MKRIVCIGIFTLFVLVSCKEITSETVLDIDLAKARLICSSDVILKINEKSCISEENARIIMENAGKVDVAGILINIDNETIQLNETIIVGQIFSRDIGAISQGNITLIPRININEKIFDCTNNLININLNQC